MNIYLADQSKQQIGGGFRFVETFIKYTQKLEDVYFTEMAQADILFIPSASMIQKDLFEQMQATKKPIILRIDNALKDSRNRGAGMSRLLKFAKGATQIIFQSIWAKEYLGLWLERNGVKIKNSPVVYNGGDTEIFYPNKQSEPLFVYRYLFIKDKRFEEAAYHFYMKSLKDKECKLTIVGRFPQELIEHNFDFFNNEKIRYMGQIGDPRTIAELMRNHDVLLFPAFADACPQTIVEARLCGMQIELVNQVGGTRELMQLPIEMIKADYMVNEYLKIFRMV